MHTVLATGASIVGGVTLPLRKGGAPGGAVSPGEGPLRDGVSATNPGLLCAPRQLLDQSVPGIVCDRDKLSSIVTLAALAGIIKSDWC